MRLDNAQLVNHRRTRVSSKTTEGLVEPPLTVSGKRRKWSAMSHDDLLSYAKYVVKAERLPNVQALIDFDEFLYRKVSEAGLRDKLKFPNPHGARSKTKIISRRESRHHFDETDVAKVLSNPLAVVPFPIRSDGGRDWENVSNPHIDAYTRKLVILQKVRNLTHLRKIDSGLAKEISLRKMDSSLPFTHPHGRRPKTTHTVPSASKELYPFLRRAKTAPKALATVPFPTHENGRRDWEKVTDEHIFAVATHIINEQKVKNPLRLRELDDGLYFELLRRGFLSHLEFERPNAPRTDWEAMGPDGIVATAEAYMRDHNITQARVFSKSNPPLYMALSRRSLLGRLNFVDAGKRNNKTKSPEVSEHSLSDEDEDD